MYICIHAHMYECVCMYVMIYTHTCISENERCDICVNYFYNDVQYESNQL
jgi:hypothetical protein